jgi:hypothetical protein
MERKQKKLLKMMKKNRKDSVKNKVKNKALSTQRYLQFSGVHDDVLVLKNGGLRAILEVSSVNFNLKSEDEQTAILKSYQAFLNALNFPVQILIRSRKLDIDQYLENLKQRQRHLQNELLRTQMLQYIEYIEKLVEYADIMEKKFYVVVPVDPARAQKKSTLGQFMSYIKPDDKVLDVITRKKEFKDLKKELDSRVNATKTSLENCSLGVRQCNTQEIIEVMYQCYNPQVSRTQKLQPLPELSVEDGPEANLVADEK